MSLIRIENISKSFAGETILESVSLRIENGEKISLYHQALKLSPYLSPPPGRRGEIWILS